MKRLSKLFILPILSMVLSSCTFLDYFNSEDQVTHISLNMNAINIVVDETFQLEATVSPEEAKNKEVTWSVNNSTIASVSDTGLVKGLKKGTTTVTVKSVSNPKVTNKCSVRVNMEGEVTQVTSLELAEEQLTLNVGDQHRISYTILPSDATDKTINWASNNPTGLSVSSDGVIKANIEGEYVITATSVSNTSISDRCYVTVTNEDLGRKEVFSEYSYKDYIDCNYYNLSASPSVGNSKLLVIPVWFTDSSNYITKKNVVKEDIENAYFGDEGSTGWESVKTYYNKDSFGKLNIDGIVTDWYECGVSSSSYYVDNDKRTSDLVEQAVSWYKSKYSVSNLKEFDQDGDGYVDGVMLIYGAPDYRSWNKQGADNLWAYCYWIQKYNANKNNPTLNAFFWASYDFMYSAGASAISRVGTRYGAGDQSHCVIDSHTYIHEMGHVFGLEDYYDYSHVHCPAAGYSMQDMNMGAHDPYSRFALGWASAVVPTKTTTLTVGSIEESGQFILLPSTDTFSGSAFDEYIILELFTPTGLNQHDCLYDYVGYKGPSAYGVRVWHVDARLVHMNGSRIGYITTNPVNSAPVIHATNNSSFTYDEDCRSINYAGSYDYNMNQLIRNDVNASNGGQEADFLDSSMLFKTNDTFSLTKYKSQFTNNNQLNNGTELRWSVRFTSVTSTQMVVECTLN